MNNIFLRAYNKPLLISQDYAETMFSYLNTRIGFTELHAFGKTLDEKAMQEKVQAYVPRSEIAEVEGDTASKFYRVIKGVAIIDVQGTLVHKSGYIGSASGMMGYDGIARQIESANKNNSVKGILLDIDSPGGEVAGVSSLVRKIKQSKKPIWASANEMAASAAYWVASATRRIYLSDSARVGSIGVLMSHADISKKLENEGTKVTLIFSGKHKVDGNPYEALPDAVQGRFQNEINKIRNEFVDAVANNRFMSVSDVYETEAQMYTGVDSVNLKLADEVADFDVVLEKFSSFLNAENGEKIGVRDMDNLSAELGDIEKVKADAVALGAKQERERIATILNSDFGKVHYEQAVHLALNTSMSAEESVGFLATLPRQEAKQFVIHGAGVSAETDEVGQGKQSPSSLFMNAILGGAK